MVKQEQSIDRLLESLDNEIFTEDMKIQMKEILNSKVNSLVESKSAQYDKKIQKISDEFEEKQEKELNEFKEEVLTTLDDYLTKVIKEFVEENEEAILEQTIVNEAVEVHKIFDSLMEQYNFKFQQKSQTAQIVSEDREIKEELQKAIEESVNLKKSVIVLKEENERLQKQLIIENYANKLDSVVDRHKFSNLAENFVFVAKEKELFENELVQLVESIVQDEKNEKPVLRTKREKELLESTSIIKEEQEVNNGRLTMQKLREQIARF